MRTSSAARGTLVGARTPPRTVSMRQRAGSFTSTGSRGRRIVSRGGSTSITGNGTKALPKDRVREVVYGRYRSKHGSVPQSVEAMVEGFLNSNATITANMLPALHSRLSAANAREHNARPGTASSSVARMLSPRAHRPVRPASSGSRRSGHAYVASGTSARVLKTVDVSPRMRGSSSPRLAAHMSPLRPSPNAKAAWGSTAEQSVRTSAVR